MLLGTFKTVFNSVFLVGTKNKTPHHMAKMERRSILEGEGERWGERDREEQEEEGRESSSSETRNLVPFIWHQTWIRSAESRKDSVDWSVFPSYKSQKLSLGSLWSAVVIPTAPRWCFIWYFQSSTNHNVALSPAEHRSLENQVRYRWQ